MCTYATQAGYYKKEKDTFWVDFDNVMTCVSENKEKVIGGYFNWHVGRNVNNMKNEEEAVLQAGTTIGLVAANTSL